jgi:hypothetical protein
MLKMKKSLSFLLLLVGIVILLSCASSRNVNFTSQKTFDGEEEYEIGDTAQGGIVFYVSKDGAHGLVAALKDQMKNSNYQDCIEGINNPLNHDEFGSTYVDWRLPKLWEAYKMYMNLHMINLGNFSSSGYWTTKSSVGFEKMYVLNFSKGLDFTSLKSDTYKARAVRSF